MILVFGRSSGVDIIRYREFVFRLLKEMEDHQARFQLEDGNSYMVLKMMLKVTKFMGIGNL